MPYATANDWYEKGNRRRQKGNLSGAMECYLRAVEMDANSPAATALQMLQDIYAFRNTDLYNP